MGIRAVKFLGYFFLLSGLLLLVLSVVISEESWISAISSWLELSEESRDKLENRLSSKVRLIFRLIMIFLAALGFWMKRRTVWISDQIFKIRNALKEVGDRVGQIPRSYRITAVCILLISFGFNLYNVILRPIFYDEAWTYLNFTSQGFITAISYYPLPNNHVLHTVLTVLTSELPFGTTVNLRLPSLFIAILAALTFGYTSFRLYGKQVALLLLPFFCLLFPVAYYGYLSRGYMLILFAFICCFYASLRLVDKQLHPSKGSWYSCLLMGGGIAGLYTMPSFIYPLFCCVSFVLASLILRRENRLARLLLLLNVIAGLIVFLLYSPILFRSGWSALVSNEMVEPLARSQVWNGLWEHFSKTSEFLFDLPLVILFPIVLVVLALLFKGGTKPWLSIYLIVMPPVLLLIHGVIPFPRTWIYLVVVVLFLVGRLLTTVRPVKRIPLSGIVVSGALIAAFLIFRFQNKILTQEFFSYRAAEIAQRVIDEQAERVYVNHALMEINLRYITNEKGVDIGIEFSRESLTPAVIQRVGESCDWLILDRQLEGPIQWDYSTGGDYPMFLGRLE